MGHQWDDCEEIKMRQRAGVITFGHGPSVAKICGACGLNQWYARYYRRMHNRAFPDEPKGFDDLFPCEPHRYCAFGKHIPSVRGNWTEAPQPGQPPEEDMPWVAEARQLLKGDGQEAGYATV